MIILLTILLIVISLIGWIVFVPVYLRINTNINQYELSQSGTISMALHPGEIPFFTMCIFGISVPVSTSKKPQRRKESVKSGRKKGRSFIKRSPQTWLYLIEGIVKSIKLKRLACTMDFMDVVLNAQLVPVMLLISRGPVQLSTNFTGQYYLHLEACAKINSVLWTFIRFLTKK